MAFNRLATVSFGILIIYIFIFGESTQQTRESSSFQQFQNCIKESMTLVTRLSNLSFYTHLNYQWNLRIPTIYPIGYLLPECSAHVQVAVRCGSKFKIRLIPKSGGHSYEGFSWGSPESVILDLRRTSRITIEAKTKIAIIESGALIGQINEKLWTSGGFGLPLGDCLTVGIGGFTLGGGYGYLAHAYGLAIDNLVEIEMIDAAGNLHIVNQAKNKDLFWALRGIGSGFIGIVTRFKFKIFTASQLKVQLLRLHYDLSFAAEILISWQKWIAWSKINAHHILGEIFILGKHTQFSQSGSSIQVDFIDVLNSFQILRNISVPDIIRNIFPPNGNTTLKIFDTYMDFLMEFADAKIKSGKDVRDLNMTTIREEEEAIQRYVKQKTFFVDKVDFSEKDLRKVGKILRRIPQKYVWVNFQSDGGVLDDAIGGENSYVHRKAFYGIIVRYEGPAGPKNSSVLEFEKIMTWLKNFIHVSEFMDSGETYQNYVDKDLNNYLQRYYGNNLPKLIELKRKWDPTNYFQNSQSLPIYIN